MQTSKLARNSLVLEHKKHSDKIVLNLKKNIGIPSTYIEDCRQCGYVGLIEAAKKYNLSSTIPFKDFAAIYIRGRVIDFLRRNLEIKKIYIRSLTTRKNCFFKKNQSENKLSSYLNLKHKFKRRLKKDSNNVKTKKPRVFFLGTEIDTVVPLLDLSKEHPLEKKEIFRLFWSKLSPFQKKIFYLYFFQDLTIKEVGIKLGLSKSWTCKLLQRVLTRYQEAIRQ